MHTLMVMQLLAQFTKDRNGSFCLCHYIIIYSRGRFPKLSITIFFLLCKCRNIFARLWSFKQKLRFPCSLCESAVCTYVAYIHALLTTTHNRTICRLFLSKLICVLGLTLVTKCCFNIDDLSWTDELCIISGKNQVVYHIDLITSCHSHPQTFLHRNVLPSKIVRKIKSLF